MPRAESGPRPEVLARLAEGAPVERATHAPSWRARAFGLGLRVATAAAVLVAIAVAGGP